MLTLSAALLTTQMAKYGNMMVAVPPVASPFGLCLTRSVTMVMWCVVACALQARQRDDLDSEQDAVARERREVEEAQRELRRQQAEQRQRAEQLDKREEEAEEVLARARQAQGAFVE